MVGHGEQSKAEGNSCATQEAEAPSLPGGCGPDTHALGRALEARVLPVCLGLRANSSLLCDFGRH